MKQELVVELLERSRKIRRLFLFHDVLVSAKEKSPRYSNIKTLPHVIINFIHCDDTYKILRYMYNVFICIMYIIN